MVGNLFSSSQQKYILVSFSVQHLFVFFDGNMKYDLLWVDLGTKTDISFPSHLTQMFGLPGRCEPGSRSPGVAGGQGGEEWGGGRSLLPGWLMQTRYCSEPLDEGKVGRGGIFVA